MGQNKKNEMRGTRQLARPKATKSFHEIIHIICEGDTECGYCRKFIQDIRLPAVTVDLGKGSAPISIIEQAIELAENNSDIDHILCIFDKDEHESYERAYNVLRRYKLKNIGKPIPDIKIFTSVPCFEIWLLLHFKYTTKPYASSSKKSAADHVCRDLKEHVAEYEKGIKIDLYSYLKDKQGIALINAKKLKKHNAKIDSINPSTNMHELIEFLINKSKNAYN